MQTTTSTYEAKTLTATRHRITAAGRYQVVDGVTAWATREAAEAVIARLDAGAAVAVPQTAEHAAQMRGTSGCHYCGLPTVRGYCRECGDEI